MSVCLSVCLILCFCFRCVQKDILTTYQLHRCVCVCVCVCVCMPNLILLFRHVRILHTRYPQLTCLGVLVTLLSDLKPANVLLGQENQAKGWCVAEQFRFPEN